MGSDLIHITSIVAQKVWLGAVIAMTAGVVTIGQRDEFSGIIISSLNTLARTLMPWLLQV